MCHKQTDDGQTDGHRAMASTAATADAYVTGNLRLQWRYEMTVITALFSTHRQAQSPHSLDRLSRFTHTAVADVLTSGPSPRRVANQRGAMGGRLGMMDARR